MRHNKRLHGSKEVVQPVCKKGQMIDYPDERTGYVQEQEWRDQQRIERDEITQSHGEITMTKEQKKELMIRESIVMPAVSPEEAVRAFEAYQSLAKKIMTDDDVQNIQGKNFKKKSFWRKCQRFFNLSVSIVSEVRDQYDGYFVYKFVVRATAPNGASMDGTGSCSSNEKGIFKTEHNARAIAETRAKNRAISDLVAFGEVSAEEVDASINGDHKPCQDEEAPFNSDVETPPDGTVAKQKELYDILVKLNNGDTTEAMLIDMLEHLTMFKGKDGKQVAGVRSLKKLTGKRLDVTLGKAKDRVKEMESI